MLTIRKEQMEILAAASGRHFENRLLAELEILFPEETARISEHADGRENLRRFIRQGFDRAASYGIENEDDYTVFVALMLFNRRPDLNDGRQRAELLTWSRVLLERPTTPGHVKMALIEYRLQQMAPGNPKAAQLCAIINTLRKRF
ncbi:MAG: hypothetical protein H6975_00445 [Gammaproteobacteria bacterium]|nr:hypothetical protein [Gammaproteobacteria bacterium]